MRLETENLRLKAELERKDKIIAGLQQRLFGSSSEKLDPAQLQLELEELLLGKSAPLPEQSGETSAPEEVKSKSPRSRRTKAQIFPENLKILIDKEIIPEEVLGNPDEWKEIGQEHHDELGRGQSSDLLAQNHSQEIRSQDRQKHCAPHRASSASFHPRHLACPRSRRTDHR